MLISIYHLSRRTRRFGVLLGPLVGAIWLVGVIMVGSGYGHGSKSFAFEDVHQREEQLINRGNQPESNFIELAHTWSEGGISEEQGGKGLLASGGSDGRIIIWQIKSSGENLEVYPVGAVRHAHGDGDVNGLQWCLRDDKKGMGMLASAGDDGSVKVWRFTEEA
jgi:WD40 repeat protein